MPIDAMPLLTPTSGPLTDPPRLEATVVVHESTGGTLSSSFDCSKLAEMAQQAAEVCHTWSSEVERLNTSLVEEKDKNERLKIMIMEEKDKNKRLKTNLAKEKYNHKFHKLILEKDKNERLKTNLMKEKDENELLKTMSSSFDPHPSDNTLIDAMPLLTSTSGPPAHAPWSEMITVVHDSATGASTTPFDWSKLTEMAQQAVEVIQTLTSEVERLKAMLVEEKDKNGHLKTMLPEEKEKNKRLQLNLHQLESFDKIVSKITAELLSELEKARRKKCR